MMKRIFFPILFLLLALCGYGRSIYVVSVGISDYKYIKDLQKSENDAKDFATLYLTHTSHVTTLLGVAATHDAILSTLQSTFAQAEKEDIVVFFFSGHGGKGGLCAYDTQKGQSLVTYAEIQQVLKACKADNKQLFIDACFAGGLRDKGKAATSQSADSSPLSDTEGVMLFLSSRTGEYSQENRWSKNGFFTQYLVKGLKGGADTDGDRIITAKEIFTFVSTNVAERTQKKQNPVMWGKFNDDMHVMNWNPKKEAQ